MLCNSKVCSKCNIEKSLEEFYNHKTHNDGKSSQCKECSKAAVTEYQKNNPDKISKKGKIYYKENSETIKDNVKKYQEKNKEKIRVRVNKRRKIRRLSDENYNIECKSRALIAVALLRNFKGSASKANAAFVLLGCTAEFYKTYITSKFTEGMTWEKYMNGEIVIDHYPIAICEVDLRIPENQYKVFHYTNTRPLWYMENAYKSAEDKKKSIRSKAKLIVESVDN